MLLTTLPEAEMEVESGKKKSIGGQSKDSSLFTCSSVNKHEMLRKDHSPSIHSFIHLRAMNLNFICKLLAAGSILSVYSV